MRNFDKWPMQKNVSGKRLYRILMNFRCSPSFLEEERRALHERRDKIRQLQQRKISEFSTLKDLPDEIPLHLVIGTKVTGQWLGSRSQVSGQGSKSQVRRYKSESSVSNQPITCHDTNSNKANSSKPGEQRIQLHFMPLYLTSIIYPSSQ